MEVKIPKVAESMPVPGAAKCTALLTLNASTWSATRNLSLIANSFRTVTSISALCGANNPSGAERAMLPSV